MKSVLGECRAAQAIDKLVSRLRSTVDQDQPALIHTRGGFGYWLGCASRRGRVREIAYTVRRYMLPSMTERPLQEPTLLLLTALADAPRHGYALIQEVAAISGGRVRLRAGTLYGALDRLLGQGIVRVEREEVVDSRLRRTYALTDAGYGMLAAEADRLRTTALEAERRIGVGRPGLGGRPAQGGAGA